MLAVLKLASAASFLTLFVQAALRPRKPESLKVGWRHWPRDCGV